MRTRRHVLRAVLAATVTLGLGIAASAPASAISQITGPYSCLTNTYVAIWSNTTGSTTHKASDGRSWYKGTFSSTTYKSTATKRSVLTWTQVNASKIASSGGICA